MSLIDLCIQNGIGFVYRPIFSINKLNQFYKKDLIVDNTNTKEIITNNYIEKKISLNDIRARILPIPVAIYEKMNPEQDCFDIYINDQIHKGMRLNRQRKYFGGITEVYRNCNLITTDNVFNPSMSYWVIKESNIFVYINKN